MPKTTAAIIVIALGVLLAAMIWTPHCDGNTGGFTIGATMLTGGCQR